ncbi:hypothetical protein BaRGS_00029397, partial [Batillaria attramentaria]
AIDPGRPSGRRQRHYKDRYKLLHDRDKRSVKDFFRMGRAEGLSGTKRRRRPDGEPQSARLSIVYCLDRHVETLAGGNEQSAGIALAEFGAKWLPDAKWPHAPHKPPRARNDPGGNAERPRNGGLIRPQSVPNEGLVAAPFSRR